jgi:hypothetical protein
VVVDGSNIATEGRSMPSLAQLNEAVLAFMAERPEVTVTVVVDATFGHRINKSEVAEFDAAVANNELVAPPAGAVGRGDAFVLGIADKAGAMVLSNDSFQEFHGTYDWLFEEGRLVGGKPVPHVGWVFVDRVPVRGPVSRRAQREPSKRAGGGSRGGSGTARIGSKEASLPMPVPTSPPPGRSRSGGRGRQAPEAPVLVDTRTAPAAAAKVAAATGNGSSDRPSGRAGEPVNDVMPFLNFVEHHPVGSSVNATVESYSSHGAYVTIGDVRGYVPLRLMDDPMPRAAKYVMKIGDAVTLVVVSFNPGRRSIDCAVPHMVGGLHLDEVLPSVEGGEEQGAPAPSRSRSTRKKAAAATPAASTDAPADRQDDAAPGSSSRRKRGAAKKAASTATAADGGGETAAPATDASTSTAPAERTPATKAPAKRAAKKVAASPASGRDDAADEAPVTGTPARTSRTRKSSAASSSATTDAAATASPTTKGPATKAPAKKAPAKKAPATKAPAKKAPATTAPATKAAATKTAATKAPAKKAPATKAPAKKAPATKAAAKKTPAAKRPAKQAADQGS